MVWCSDPPNPMLNKAIRLLQQLSDLCPGALMAQMLLAKAAFIAGDFDEAERSVSALVSICFACGF